MITSTPCTIDCPQTCGHTPCGAPATVTSDGPKAYSFECQKGHKGKFDDRFAATATPKGN